MKIATWNVNGIRARHAQFAEWLEQEKPDVVCLQEIKATPAQVPESICSLEGYSCYWHGAGGYSGVGLHIRSDVFAAGEFSHPKFDHETRIVQADVGEYVFVSVYVPNGGKDYEAKIGFMKALRDYAGELRSAGRQFVICGDLNVALTDLDVHPKERKPGIIGQRPEEREILASLIAEDLVDVGRTLHPEDGEFFTWWAPWRNMRQRNIGWRIDYILASSSLASRAVACESLREIGTSDHAPLVATFS